MSQTFSRAGHRAAAPIDPPGTMRVRRAAFWTMAAALGLTGVWSVGLTGFIYFRDDLSARLIERQVESQYAYEERIAALKAHVDRLASRQMIDQDSVEARVDELMSRQAQLETRGAMVAMLAQTVGSDGGSTQARKTMPDAAPPTPSLAPAAPPPSALSFAPSSPRPLPVFEEPLRGADGIRPTQSPPRDAGEPLKRRVSALGQSLATMERQQVSALDRIETQSRGKVQRLRRVMTEAGVDPDRIAPPASGGKDAGGVGGPLVPLSAAEGFNFETALAHTKTVIEAEKRLSRASKSLPIRFPLGHPADVTSPFGVRNDPFTRGYAMHTGIDFRAETGAPARATGAGVVTIAEYYGGYGNMVEVDHGNGLATRYAHLSAILVSEGQKVEAGAVVGRVGSTGRSTGSHLHYETRVTGDATDPTRFLKLGGRYRDLL